MCYSLKLSKVFSQYLSRSWTGSIILKKRGGGREGRGWAQSQLEKCTDFMKFLENKLFVVFYGFFLYKNGDLLPILGRYSVRNKPQTMSYGAVKTTSLIISTSSLIRPSVLSERGSIAIGFC